MAELKTTANDGDVDVFLSSITDKTRRADGRAIRALMSEVLRALVRASFAHVTGA